MRRSGLRASARLDPVVSVGASSPPFKGSPAHSGGDPWAGASDTEHSESTDARGGSDSDAFDGDEVDEAKRHDAMLASKRSLAAS